MADFGQNRNFRPKQAILGQPIPRIWPPARIAGFGNLPKMTILAVFGQNRNFRPKQAILGQPIPRIWPSALASRNRQIPEKRHFRAILSRNPRIEIREMPILAPDPTGTVPLGQRQPYFRSPARKARVQNDRFSLPAQIYSVSPSRSARHQTLKKGLMCKPFQKEV